MTGKERNVRFLKTLKKQLQKEKGATPEHKNQEKPGRINRSHGHFSRLLQFITCLVQPIPVNYTNYNCLLVCEKVP